MQSIEELKKVILVYIAVINSNRNYVKNMKLLMIQMFNVPAGDTIDILNGKLPVEGMSLDTIYKVSKCMYEVIKDIPEYKDDIYRLNVESYFNKNQRMEFDKKLVDEEEIGDIIFPKFLKFASDMFAVEGNSELMNKLRDARRIKYNYKTQRKVTIRENNGTEVKMVTLNNEARSDIHTLMANNEFIPNMLAININPYENDNMPYVTDKGELVIPKDCTLDIADGFHRYLEMTSVKDENPDWEYTTGLYICMFDEDKANRFIWQEDHKTHLQKEQKETMNKSDELNYWLDRLNDSDKFHLKRTLNDEKLFIIGKTIRHFEIGDIDKRKGMNIFNEIQTEINDYVEKQVLFDKEITKQEWFVLISCLYYCKRNNLKFIDFMDNVNMTVFTKKFDFKNEPTTKQFGTIIKLLDEVK